MKQAYIISYDVAQLSDESETYQKLFKYIKGHRTWAHINKSVWAIKTDKSASEIRDEILEIVPEDSSVFVIRSGVEAAWSNVLCRNKWLKDHL
jgi:CRISPR associated protein Cas2